MTEPDDFVRQCLPPRDQWPELVFDLPELHYPARLNAVAELLDRRAEGPRAGAPCILGDGVAWTYADTAAQVNRICNVLAGPLALRSGQPVLIRGFNAPMTAACFLAVIKAGGVAVPTMPMLRARELAYTIDKARIALALCDARLAHELEATQAPTLRRTVLFHTDAPGGLEALMKAAPDTFAAAETAAEDPCLIAFTSGTTGEPKGAMHLHRDLLATCDSYGRHVLRPRPDDRFIGSPPLAFTFGLGGHLLFPLRAGASTVLVEKASPDDLLAAIPRHRPTILFTAPTAYRAMLAKMEGADLSSLRICVSAGEHLPKATYEAWKQATGISMMDGIGSTEMLHIFIGSPAGETIPGSTGRVVPGYQARILGPDGADAPDGTPGRLAVRGPTGCRYMSDPRQQAYVQDGWNITGDSFIRDARGYFWYQARNDDMIVSSGYNIAGPEVEQVLMQHEAVAECAVVGVPDRARGMRVTAVVVLRPGHTGGAAMTEALQNHVKASIAPYKYPRAILYRDTLPRTPTGKLQHYLLREEASRDAG
jgi:2-aminobenzoate-CoA ligase